MLKNYGSIHKCVCGFFHLSKVNHKKYIGPTDWLLSCKVYEIAEDCPFLQQEKVAKTSCMSACKHVATSLMNFLMDNNIKQVTMGALQQFNLDLIQCERKSSLFAKFVGQGFSRNSCVKSWHSRNYVEI